MILCTTLERLKTDTANGYQLKVVYHYSSFDEREIDKIEQLIREEIGSGTIKEYKLASLMAKGEVEQ